MKTTSAAPKSTLNLKKNTVTRFVHVAGTTAGAKIITTSDTISFDTLTSVIV
ncbi:hypothetical protein [Hymenobacter persicinus]|uniref:hypothetical protein n=1 Tax=Hymenobacter persicinus TaxID=2025506 RepID=UPI0013EC20D9|nr:hypothetical protein [Hymenobacter persicinus]